MPELEFSETLQCMLPAGVFKRPEHIMTYAEAWKFIASRDWDPVWDPKTMRYEKVFRAVR
jgi:hypothetical protein